jgi:hypothetical protein
MKSLDETKAAILVVVSEANGKPLSFMGLVRAVRIIDSEFSYYPFIYSKALRQLEEEGLVLVTGCRTKNGRSTGRGRQQITGPVGGISILVPTP